MNDKNDGAGITAQARAYLAAHLAVGGHGWTDDDELRLTDLLDTVDAVDAVHAGALAALEEAHAELDDCVALPVDADGVTIRPLDWVTDHVNDPFEVGSISIIGDVSGWTVYDWEERDNDPSRLHHCEKPKKAILKDMLKDFAIDCSRHHCGGPVFDDLAENLASHLQLVEDGDGAC